MTASQSSTDNEGTPEKALTGSPQRNWHGLDPHTCTHTKNDAGAWWMVSLSGIWDVTSVQLSNRAGCCPNRLQGIDVYVGNTKCASSISVGDETKTIPCVATGNSIKLQHTGTSPLTLCGFAAMGAQGKHLVLWCHSMASKYCLAMLPHYAAIHSAVSRSCPMVLFYHDASL